MLEELEPAKQTTYASDQAGPYIFEEGSIFFEEAGEVSDEAWGCLNHKKSMKLIRAENLFYSNVLKHFVK